MATTGNRASNRSGTNVPAMAAPSSPSGPGPFLSSIQQELRSFRTPEPKPFAPLPRVGSRAPNTTAAAFPSPKPVLLVFLRHIGCPFAEKTFKLLTAFSTRHPEIHCVAVSHSPAASTDAWVIAVGGQWEAEVVSDPRRDMYAAWGLCNHADSKTNDSGEDSSNSGNKNEAQAEAAAAAAAQVPTTSWLSLVDPRSLYAAYRLGADEGIWNRPVGEGGSRWQAAGAFAVDANGYVRWAWAARGPADVPDLDEALAPLEPSLRGLA